MTITLDPVIEQRLQRELAVGPFREPSDLIAHALDLVESERDDLALRRARIVGRLDESIAQGERGDTYSPEEVRDYLAGRRAGYRKSATPA